VKLVMGSVFVQTCQCSDASRKVGEDILLDKIKLKNIKENVSSTNENN
jgi:hypothetical protein